MGFGWRDFFIGAALVAAAFIPGLNATVASMFLAGGLSFIGKAIPKPTLEQQRQGALVQGVSTQNAVRIVYGEARVAGQIVFQDAKGTGLDTPNAHLDIVAALCMGSRAPQGSEAADAFRGMIGGVGPVFFDDYQAFKTEPLEVNLTDGYWKLDPDENLVTFVATGIGDVASFHVAQMWAYLGMRDQVANDYMISRWGSDPRWPWTADHRLQGIAYYVVNAFFRQKKFPRGVPNITSMVRGRRCYDLRLNGGAGGWPFEANSNASLVVRDYLLDPIAGGAVDIEKLNEPSFLVVADRCDEIVTGSDGTPRPRHTINGVVDTNRAVKQNVQDMLRGFQGFLAFEQGEFHLRQKVESIPPVDLILDESNIVGDWSFGTTTIDNRVNLVIGNYVDLTVPSDDPAVDTTMKDQIMQAQYPPEGAENPYVIEDGGIEIPREVDFPFIANKAECEAACRAELLTSRAVVTAALTAHEDAMILALLDKVRVHHPRPQWNMKPFWVEGLGLQADLNVRVALREATQVPLIEPAAIPDEEPQPLPGKPMENLYADGHVWIGAFSNDGGSNTPGMWVFDVLTDERTDLDQLQVTFARGAAYHRDRKEMWVAGVRGTSTPYLDVFDTTTITRKDSYEYDLFDSFNSPAAVEVCPQNGMIFAGFIRLGSGVSNTVSVVEIDPADGEILRAWSPVEFESDAGCEGQAGAPVFSMVWDAAHGVMACALNLGNVWTIDPVTGVHTQMSGPLEGLAAGETSGMVPEQEYVSTDGLIYALRDIRRDVFRYDGTPGGACLTSPGGGPNAPVFVGFGSTLADPGGFALLHLPHLQAIAVSRGHPSILFSDPNANGRVTVFDLDGNILRDFIVGFNPARLSYVPPTDSICAVSWWNQDTEWLKQYLGLAGVLNAPADFPPDQPSDPTAPAPGPGGEIAPGPGGDEPTITAVRDYCVDGITEDAPDSETWSGTIETGAEIDYTDNAAHPGNAVTVRLWPDGADTDLDSPSIEGAVALDGDTVRLKSFEKTVDSTPTLNKPVCPGAPGANERDAFDQFWQVRIKHNAGADWSNTFHVRVRNPRPFITEEESSEPDFPPDPTAAGAPSWASAEVHCVNFYEADDVTIRKVTVDAQLWALSAEGSGKLGIEYLEMNQGERPGDHSPLRTHIIMGTAAKKYTWRIWEVHDAGAKCGGPSSVPDLVRDYYARHVTGPDTRGPLSPVRTLTFVHPGPV